MTYCPPRPDFLRGIANRNTPWKDVFAEWIDNAFDRNANRVSFLFDDKHLTIEDDGEGTSRPEAIVTLGDHAPTEGVGEYGVGGTASLLWAGGEKSDVSIRSTHRGITRRLDMNWGTFAALWELPEPREIPARAGDIGTTITVSPLKARCPIGPAFDRCCEELGYRYSRALRDHGKQISIKGPKRIDRPRTIIGWTPPDFDLDLPMVRNAEISVGTKKAFLTAGVVKQGIRNPRPGLTYYYKYRAILGPSSRGCGSYNIARLCGFVELSSGWKSSLTTEKTGLVRDYDELFIAVERILEPVLKAAETSSSTFATKDLIGQIEAQLSSAIGKLTQPKAKAKRKPGDQQGTVVPIGSSRRHRDARNKQDGTRFPPGSDGHAVRVSFEQLGGSTLGRAIPPNIILNLDNEFVLQARDRHDSSVLALAAATLMAHADCNQEDPTGQRYLPGAGPKEFPEQVGWILSGTALFDGQSLIEVKHPC